LLGKKVESKKAGNNIDDNRVPCKIMEDWYEMERKRGMTSEEEAEFRKQDSKLGL